MSTLKKICVIYVMIGPDYIKIMRVIQEVESEYIKNLRNTESNGDARRYYLNGIQALREVKGKIKRNYEKKTPEKLDSPAKWYHFWRDNF